MMKRKKKPSKTSNESEQLKNTSSPKNKDKEFKGFGKKHTPNLKSNIDFREKIELKKENKELIVIPKKDEKVSIKMIPDVEVKKNQINSVVHKDLIFVNKNTENTTRNNYNSDGKNKVNEVSKMKITKEHLMELQNIVQSFKLRIGDIESFEICLALLLTYLDEGKLDWIVDQGSACFKENSSFSFIAGKAAYSEILLFIESEAGALGISNISELKIYLKTLQFNLLRTNQTLKKLKTQVDEFLIHVSPESNSTENDNKG